MFNPGIFEPNWAHELCNRVEGVDGKLLADLYDCVAKFGRYYNGKQMRVLSRETPTPITVSVVIDPPGNYNTTVSRIPGGILKARLKCLLLSDDRSACFWDSDITPAEIRDLIKATDDEMRSVGFLDDGVTRRMVVRDDDRPGLLEVDKIFLRPGIVYFFPDETDPDTLLAKFDRPEELHVVNVGRVVGFIHKNDSKLVLFADVSAAVLARHGITDQRLLERLPRGVQERIASEIVAEMRRRNN